MILGAVIPEGADREKINVRTDLRFTKPSFMVVKPKYQVTFDSNGGTAVASQTVSEGQPVGKPADPQKENHTFKYWALYENVADWEEGVYDFSRPITRDIILKAVYQEVKKHELDYLYRRDPHLEIYYDDVTPSENLRIWVYDGDLPPDRPQDPSRPGYRFLYWETLIQGVGYQPFDFNEPVYKNYKLYPVYASTEQFTVSFDADGGAPTPAAQQVVNGDKATKPADPQKENYSFDYWGIYRDGSIENVFDFNTPISEDITLKAVYHEAAVQKFTVSFDADGGAPAPAAQQVVNGDKATKPAEPQKENYSFDYWGLYRDGSIENAFDFNTPISEDITLKAVYHAVTAQKFTVSFDADGGAPVPAAQQVESGQKATKPAADPAKSGYNYIGWYNGEQPYDFNQAVTKDLTLTAKYAAKDKLIVTFDAAGGAPQPATQQVESGQKASKPAADPVKTGQTFIGWYNGNQLYDFNKPVVESITLVAHYQSVDKFKIVFDTAGGQPEPPIQYVVSGARADRPTVNPIKEGYDFIGWYTALGEYDFSAPVERNTIIYAKYQADGSSHDRSRRQDIDIADDDYDKAIISYKEAFFKGYPDGSFKPESTISRAEMATVFVRLLNLQSAPLNGTIAFSDTSGHWAEQNILRAAEYGLLNGYPDGSFQPEGKMKRAEIASIINKYWQIKGFVPNNQAAPISDIDKHWAKQLILSLYNHRFIDLYSDKSFKPDAPLKRADVAQILNRITDRPLVTLEFPTFIDVQRNHWAYDEVNTAAKNLISEQ